MRYPFQIKLDVNWKWWEVGFGINFGTYDEWFITVSIGPFMLTIGWQEKIYEPQEL